MATEIEIVEEEVAEGKNSLFSGVRRILMAGLGAAALAQEEVDEFVGKLVERGEIAEKDGRKLIDEFKERRRTKAHEAEEALDGRLEKLLDRMNIPSKRDVETLTEKIAQLSDKVDELKAKKK